MSESTGGDGVRDGVVVLLRRCPSCGQRHWRRGVELPQTALPALLDAVGRSDVEAILALIERGGVALDAMHVTELTYLICPFCWDNGRLDVQDHDYARTVDGSAWRHPLRSIVVEGSALRRLVEASEIARSALLLRRWRYPRKVMACPQCQAQMPVVPILWGTPDTRSPGSRGAIAAGCRGGEKGAPKVGCVRCDWYPTSASWSGGPVG